MKTTATAATVALLSFVIGNIWIFLSAEMFVQYFYETLMPIHPLQSELVIRQRL